MLTKEERPVLFQVMMTLSSRWNFSKPLGEMRLMFWVLVREASAVLPSYPRLIRPPLEAVSLVKAEAGTPASMGGESIRSGGVKIPPLWKLPAVLERWKLSSRPRLVGSD